MVPDFILCTFLHPVMFIPEFGTNDIVMNPYIDIDQLVHRLLNFADALSSRYNSIVGVMPVVSRVNNIEMEEDQFKVLINKCQ